MFSKQQKVKKILHLSEINPKRTIKKALESSQPIPSKRLWLYRLVALIVLPVFFFMLLEILLRLAHFGYPTSAILRQEKNNIVYIHDNTKFGYQFFSKDLVREFTPFRLSAQKPLNTYRIFILGGSAAQGTPDAAFSFGRILEVMLQIQYPTIHFEVITLAMPAINSHVVLKIANDCLPYQPDLFVCYMGNNEIVGPYGPGTVFAPFLSNLTLLRFIINLKTSKTAQLVTSILEQTGLLKKSFPGWQGMKMFLEKQIRNDDPELYRTYTHFANNLKSLCQLSIKNGIKLITCTVCSNLKDCPPFTSLHRQNLNEMEKKNWETLYKRGVVFENESEYAKAIQFYLDAIQIDSTYADLHFRLGRCYWQMGHYKKARERYKKSLQLDTNRFRVDDRINQIIRITAGNFNKNIYLVDALQKFEENSPHGIPGKELFLEHVHLNFKGNYLLAKSVFDRLSTILPDRFKDNARKNINISDSLCAVKLVYNDLEKYKITQSILNNFIKKPPFTNQLYHSQTVRDMAKTLDSLKSSITPDKFRQTLLEYEKAIQIRPSDWQLHWKYAGLLASTDVGKYQEAAQHFRFVQTTLPHYVDVYVMLGLISGKLGRLSECITLNKKAIQINPTIAEAYFNLGLVYQMQGYNKRALDYYQKTLFYKPEHSRAYNNISIINYRQGFTLKAIETLNKGLSFIPEDLELYYNLAIIFNATGNRKEAIETLRRALQINPNAVKIEQKLKSLLIPK